MGHIAEALSLFFFFGGGGGGGGGEGGDKSNSRISRQCLCLKHVCTNIHRKSASTENLTTKIAMCRPHGCLLSGDGIRVPLGFHMYSAHGYNIHVNCQFLLSCQPMVTVTSCLFTKI